MVRQNDQTDPVPQIVADEKAGNYTKAFDDARDYVYGPLANTQNMQGWSERATQLATDLKVALGSDYLPPFTLVENQGIAPNSDVFGTEAVHSHQDVSGSGGTQVDLPSGYKFVVSSDYSHLTVSMANSPPRDYTYNSVNKRYELYIPGQKTPPLETAYRLLPNPKDLNEPSLVVIDPRSPQETIMYMTNGDVVTSATTLLPDGTPIYSNTEKANGLNRYTQGTVPSDQDQAKIPPILKGPGSVTVTYPDQTKIAVTYASDGSATTYISFTDQNNHTTVQTQQDGDIFAQHHDPLLEKVPIADGYTIDNNTLSVTFESAEGPKHYLLRGWQPEMDAEQAQAAAGAPNPFVVATPTGP